MKRRPITIVVYHSISKKVDPFTVRPETFRCHMEYIQQNFDIIRLTDIQKLLQKDRQYSRKVIITFDDALLDFFDNAYPVLEKLSIPCTVFVPTGFLGGYNDWYPSNFPQKAVMSANHLISLQAAGLVDFGSHTVDHLRLSQLPVNQLEHQVAESKFTLQKILEKEIIMFAYPFGFEFSRLTTRILRKTGYKIGLTTLWGTRNSAGNLLLLRRIFFHERDNAKSLRRKIEGSYDWMAFRDQVRLRHRFKWIWYRVKSRMLEAGS